MKPARNERRREEASIGGVGDGWRECLRAYEEQEIVQAVRELASERGETVTLQEFSRATGISSWTVYRRFGSWLKLRQSAGLPGRRTLTGRGRRHSAESIERAMREYVERHGERVRLSAFSRETGISAKAIASHIGSWGELRQRGGLPAREQRGVQFSDRDLLEELDRVVRKLGRIPTEYEFNREARCSMLTLYKRFGNKADVVSRYRAYIADQQEGGV